MAPLLAVASPCADTAPLPVPPGSEPEDEPLSSLSSSPDSSSYLPQGEPGSGCHNRLALLVMHSCTSSVEDGIAADKMANSGSVSHCPRNISTKAFRIPKVREEPPEKFSMGHPMVQLKLAHFSVTIVSSGPLLGLARMPGRDLSGTTGAHKAGQIVSRLKGLSLTVRLRGPRATRHTRTPPWRSWCSSSGP